MPPQEYERIGELTGNSISEEFIKEIYDGYSTFSGTCTVTNEYKGITSSITINWKIEMPGN